MEIEKINGADGIKKLFEYTLKSKEKTIRTALTDRPLVYLAGEEFAKHYIEQRMKHNLSVKSLRFTKSDIESNNNPNCNANKEIKIAPSDVKMDRSMVICDDWVAIIDYKNVNGVIIHDRENAEIMKKWFDYIWSKSS